MHNRGRTKVVGAINYKINNIVLHYHWVIYKILFREELKSNFISQSNSIGVCNTCLFMFKGVLKNNSADHFTFVVTTLGSLSKRKFFLFPAQVTKTETYSRLQKDCNGK